ncbi:hypothetical protein LZC95_14240 [Pendulispora brunnea]|uniref:Multidrug ABC transporter ATPase n=1 Tax=Pendulispora brunnea TaxID=2905690 RepID=A0ABZ2KK56_9BACT
MTAENEQEVRPDLMGWFFAIVASLFIGLVLIFVFGEIFMNPNSTQDGSEKAGPEDVLFFVLLFAPVVATVLGRKRIGWLRRSLYKPAE